jgi:hypothetical protein
MVNDPNPKQPVENDDQDVAHRRAAERRSWRPIEFAQRRHPLSLSQVYEEIREGRLDAVKVGTATLITAEGEAKWLAKLPPFATHRSPAPKRKPVKELKDVT